MKLQASSRFQVLSSKFGIRIRHIRTIRYSLIVTTTALVTLTSCKKDPIIEEIHQNKIVNGNVAPPFNGVSTLQIENYVNKLYIDLISREPSDAELDADVAYLKTNNLNEAAREQVADDLMQQYAYYKRHFEITSARFLSGIDSVDILETLQLYQFLIAQAYQTGDTLLAYLLEYEYAKYSELYTASSEYADGTIDINEYYSRFMSNGFYDEINMGSTNFVLACFENCYFRFPTAAELAQGVAMVDGASSQLFLVDGNSKADFIDIVTQVPEFYEGLVIENYRSLLSRNPNSYEMDSLTQVLEQTGDLQEMQKHVFKSEEYAGF